MVSLYAALAADRIVFNSHYNRDTFLTGVATLLAKLPDLVPGGVPERLTKKARVLPVPLAPHEDANPDWPGTQGKYPERPLRLLWSGRLEHDKGGVGLLHILEHLDIPFELAVTGQQFRDTPSEFEQIKTRFSDRIVHFGYIESAAAYRALQAAADMVLSTALHEYQGLAVLEAVAAGCLPVVPDRLAYRELYPDSVRYPSQTDNAPAEAAGAVRLIRELATLLAQGSAPGVEVAAFDQAALAPVYRAELLALAG